MHRFSRRAARLSAFLLFLFPFTRTFAQLYNPVIDVQHYDFSIALNDDSNSIRGTAIISDYKRTREYARVFEGAGMEVTRHAPNWLTTFPPLTILVAHKRQR